MNTRKAEKLIRSITIITLTFMICWGLVLVLVQVKPFWVDEWRVIYNLKFKSATALYGPLDFMQQFPRVYLIIIKSFTNTFDYSYFALRFPSFATGAFCIVFCYWLMKKLYRPDNLNRFLFILILVSSYTFTEYFVQIKQYTMDILLSLVAIGQLAELLDLNVTTSLRKGRYLLLCVSFLMVPFFSYTYPIAIAPVFIIIALRHLLLIRFSGFDTNKRTIILQWVPLIISLFSISVFYVADVAQVMADKGMQQFWGKRMLQNGFDLQLCLSNMFELFSDVGSGLLFTIIFGILGSAAFIFGIIKYAQNFSSRLLSGRGVFVLYSLVLLLTVFALYVAGKFPLGESRLNAFAIPSITILIIYLLDELKTRTLFRRSVGWLSVVLYAGVIGNIYTTFASSVSGEVYQRKLDTYVSTENAIILAQERKLPIFITPEVAYPYDKTRNFPYNNTVPGDWVLKTFPAYKVSENITVHGIESLNDVKARMRQLNPKIMSVLAGDGRTFRIINRSEL